MTERVESDVFNVDRFAPPPLRFELRGVRYAVHADPDVELVAQMLRIEKTLRSRGRVDAAGDLVADVGDDEPLAFEDALVDGREILLDLIEEQQGPLEDRSAFRIGAGDLLIIFALIVSGPDVATAVAEAITAGMAPPPASGPDPGEGGAPFGSPSRSTRRSSARSSRSRSRTAGSRTTSGG